MKEAKKMMTTRASSDNRKWTDTILRRLSNTEGDVIEESDEDEKEPIKNGGAIDEVEALQGVFYSFFSDKNKQTEEKMHTFVKMDEV
jgi:hypothetical protein